MKHTQIFKAFSIILAAGLLAGIYFPASTNVVGEALPAPEGRTVAQAAIPYFRYPVVPGSTISGHFDHNTNAGRVTFYNGRANLPGAGFYFECTNPNMYDWVGCEDNVAGEPGCVNNRELWYDGHKGTDYEFASDWHTGAFCNPGKFTQTMPIYAPARGRVVYAGYNPGRPANGYHIRLEHDLNNNGSYSDDNFRSIYLHFTKDQLAVVYGQIVQQGQYLGLGGSTGYSSSPHLHFEIQRSSDNFVNTNWSVDPYGWTGSGDDPWDHENVLLFDLGVQNNNPPVAWLPLIIVGSKPCPGCGELLQNRGFEGGNAGWGNQGFQVITNTGFPITPYSGSWLAWLGGRNSGSDTLYQDFWVPNGLAGAQLTYQLRVTTEETGGVYDTFRVRLLTTSGEVVQELEGLDNTFTPVDQWVQRTIDLSTLTGRQGQVLRLQFEATMDSNLKTSFYVDEVSLQAFAP